MKVLPIGSAPLPAIVDALEEILEAAKAGDVRSLALATFNTRQQASGVFVEGDGNLLTLIGEMRLIEHRIADHVREINGGRL